MLLCNSARAYLRRGAVRSARARCCAAFAAAVSAAGIALAQSPELVVGGCRVVLEPDWTMNGGAASARDGSLVQLMPVAGPEIVLDMVKGSDFERV